MLKQMVAYKDFDDNDQEDVLYFNISKTELTEHLDLQDKFQAVLDMFRAAEGRLTEEQVQRYLDVVKEVMQIAYGERSEDGKRFRKSAQVWADFKDSAAYDAYLFSLFTDPEKANNFLIGVLPQDLRAEAEAEVAKQTEVGITVPASSVDQSELSDEDLLKMNPRQMTQEQLWRAMELKAKR